ncbi:MAG TPA: hypothetical protein PLP30_00615 [Clostridia bacterium]|nr:hypothetical protein [Clostridia bacterium]
MKKILILFILIAVVFSFMSTVSATDGYHFWAYGAYDQVEDDYWVAGWAEIGYFPSYYIYITAELRLVGSNWLLAQDDGEGFGWATADTPRVWGYDPNYCYVNAPYWMFK